MQPIEPELSNILKNPYPRGITPEARAAIDGYINQGKTPEVSVALFIITSDASSVFDSLYEQMEADIIKGSVEYRFNMIFGITQTTAYYASGSIALLKAAGEPLPENPSQDRLSDHMLEHIDKGIALEEELTMDEVEQKGAVLQANIHLFTERVTEVFRTKQPLEAIDIYTKLESQQLAIKLGKGLLARTILQNSLREGRRRFHELFEDIQRPLSESVNF